MRAASLALHALDANVGQRIFQVKLIID